HAGRVVEHGRDPVRVAEQLEVADLHRETDGEHGRDQHEDENLDQRAERREPHRPAPAYRCCMQIGTSFLSCAGSAPQICWICSWSFTPPEKLENGASPEPSLR